jgi:transcriptional regulator with XRE-family HTH domain
MLGISTMVALKMAARRWRAADLAHRAGVAEATVHRLLNHRDYNPSVALLLKIATAFDVTPNELLLVGPSRLGLTERFALEAAKLIDADDALVGLDAAVRQQVLRNVLDRLPAQIAEQRALLTLLRRQESARVGAAEAAAAAAGDAG